MGTGSDRVMRIVLDAVRRHNLLSSAQGVVVGVSGGPDSVCLLHILQRLAPELGLDLHVGHLNHGIRGADADADADFVQQLADDWQLPVTIGQLDVPVLARQHKMSIEEAARSARYAFLAELAVRIGAPAIAVAHNADDQTETVLMHWLRGSGISGLRGMLPATPLSDYRLIESAASQPLALPLTLIRPLLDVPRSSIEAYCADHGLQTRLDRSNLDTSYFRNRLRHELLPFLENYNPNIRQVLRRSAAIMAADYELLQQQLDEAWSQCLLQQGPQAVIFDLEAWRELQLGLRRATVREAVRRLRQALRNINFEHVEQAVEIAFAGETGEQATLPQGLILTVGYDSITIADLDYRLLPDFPWLEQVVEIAVNIPGETLLPRSGWRLQAELCESYSVPDVDFPGGWEACLDARVVGSHPCLRTRRAGDRFYPLGMQGSRKRLNEFMINQKIPAGWRDSVPLLVDRSDQILWVCGWRPDHRARVTCRSRQLVHFRFERRTF